MLAEIQVSKSMARRALDLGLPDSLELRLPWGTVFINGGPYRSKPADMFGVKLAREIKAPFDVNLPIRDFSVPDVGSTHVALKQVLERLAQAHREGDRGFEVYVGCMGGRGRTGLFLAVMAKAAGVSDPVAYVRSAYNPHAVETREQARWVEDFDVTGYDKWLQSIARRGWRERVRLFFRTLFDK